MSGFNTEAMFQGEAFHVQTQDKGPRAQYVESLVYKSGKLVSSRKTFYTQFLNDPDLRTKVGRIMEDQHRNILKEIADGKFKPFLSSEKKE
jgi:hypothetical protein